MGKPAVAHFVAAGGRNGSFRDGCSSRSNGIKTFSQSFTSYHRTLAARCRFFHLFNATRVTSIRINAKL